MSSALCPKSHPLHGLAPGLSLRHRAELQRLTWGHVPASPGLGRARLHPCAEPGHPPCAGHRVRGRWGWPSAGDTGAGQCQTRGCCCMGTRLAAPHRPGCLAPTGPWGCLCPCLCPCPCPLPSGDIGAQLYPRVTPVLGSPQRGAGSPPRGEAGGAVLVLGPSPAVPTPAHPPADAFQVRRQRVPPGQGTGTGTASHPPAARLSQRVRLTHRAPGRPLCGDPAGVQTPGGPGPTRWHTRACRGCSRGSARPWLGALGARGRRWDGPWVAPRKPRTRASG